MRARLVNPGAAWHNILGSNYLHVRLQTSGRPALVNLPPVTLTLTENDTVQQASL
jgi:hypothetical protein